MRDTFKTSQVQNEVSGIFRSDEPQNQNVAYVHLKALQQATDKNFGIVTQFHVKVDDPARMDDVAAAIESGLAGVVQRRPDEQVAIHVCGPEGLRRNVTLGELLPLAFGPENLR